MELVNSTPIPAKLVIARLRDVPYRAGIALAKATFRFEDGRVELDTQSPHPLVSEPTEEVLGSLPVDHILDSGDVFEVMLFGHAYAPTGTAVKRRSVALTVGHVRRELVVSGDRRWTTTPGGPKISEPSPFERMPLTWSRAFGGECDVEIDEGTAIKVRDPYNPAGRGFDAEGLVAAHAKFLRPPLGFPRYRYERLLPNVERPDALVSTPTDTPMPGCWAALPVASPFRVMNLQEHLHRPASLSSGAMTSAAAVAHLLRNAPADWHISVPPPGRTIALEGLTSEETVAFPMPDLRVVLDGTGSRGSFGLRLLPRSLVILPDERRFYVLYRCFFRSVYDATKVRSARLRLEHGTTA